VSVTGGEGLFNSPSNVDESADTRQKRVFGRSLDGPQDLVE
jgi:hypothetical protein